MIKLLITTKNTLNNNENDETALTTKNEKTIINKIIMRMNTSSMQEMYQTGFDPIYIYIYIFETGRRLRLHCDDSHSHSCLFHKPLYNILADLRKSSC